MHLRCPNCRLTLEVDFFEVDGALASLCYFCRQQALASLDYFNGDALALAQATGQTYVRQPTAATSAPATLALNKHDKKLLISLIQNYQSSPEAVHQQVPLATFAQKILQIEAQTITYETTGDFVQDMAHLGFDLTSVFHQNQLDYTTRQLIREHYHYTCQYCGRYGDSVDHKDPVFFSQDNQLSNLTLACRECNQLKGHMSYALFTALNRRLAPLNRDLVKFEKTLHHLDDQIQDNRHQLAAQQHLTTDIQDPKLNQFRKKAKTLQFVYDSVQSDYQKLITLRHDFIQAQAKVQARYPK